MRWALSDSDWLLSIRSLPERSDVVLRQYIMYLSTLPPPQCAMEKEDPP